MQAVTKGPGTTGGKKILEQLDITHERAQAINNFRLPDGQQRLKMVSQPTSKRKRRLPVEYDIHFTDLQDPKVEIHSSDIPEDLSDDDLPVSIVPAPGFSQTNLNHDEERQKLCQDSMPDVKEPPKKRLRHDVMDLVSVTVGSTFLAVFVPVAANPKVLSGKIILARFRIFRQ